MSGEKILLVLCLAFVCSAQLVCPKITCGTNTGTACYTYTASATAPTAVSSKCAKGYYCPFSYSANSVDYSCTVIPGPSVVANVLPGMKCNATMTCITSATCKSGYCVGVASGGSCTSTGQCAPGYYCKGAAGAMTCMALLSAGATCVVGTDYCTYGYDCLVSVCTKLHSIANGGAVDNTACSALGYSHFCVSGTCYTTTGATPTSQCIAPYVNTMSYNAACTGNTCTGSSMAGTTTVTATNNCGCGLAGVPYCGGFNGDEYGVRVHSIDVKYYAGSDIKKCNVLAGVACLSAHGSSTTYWERVYYGFYATSRWKIIGADSCLYEHLDYSYSYIKNEYDDAESSSGQFLALSALVLSLVA